MAGRAQPRRHAADEGQATAELALVLPFVAVLLLLIVQVALVVRDQIMVVHAAREGARAAAAADGDRTREGVVAAVAASGLPVRDVEVDVSERAGADAPETVRVEVRYASPTDVPLVGALLGDVTLRASAIMRVEPD